METSEEKKLCRKSDREKRGVDWRGQYVITLKHMEKGKGVRQIGWNPGRSYLELDKKEENCELQFAHVM